MYTHHLNNGLTVDIYSFGTVCQRCYDSKNGTGSLITGLIWKEDGKITKHEIHDMECKKGQGVTFDYTNKYSIFFKEEEGQK